MSLRWIGALLILVGLLPARAAAQRLEISGTCYQGQEIRFTVLGPPGSYWMLYAAHEARPLSFGPYGVLEIGNGDPQRWLGSLIELGRGLMPAQGSVEMRFPFPIDPFQLEVLHYVQAFVVPLPIPPTPLQILTNHWTVPHRLAWGDLMLLGGSSPHALSFAASLDNHDPQPWTPAPNGQGSLAFSSLQIAMDYEDGEAADGYSSRAIHDRSVPRRKERNPLRSALLLPSERQLFALEDASQQQSLLAVFDENARQLREVPASRRAWLTGGSTRAYREAVALSPDGIVGSMCLDTASSGPRWILLRTDAMGLPLDPGARQWLDLSPPQGFDVLREHSLRISAGWVLVIARERGSQTDAMWIAPLDGRRGAQKLSLPLLGTGAAAVRVGSFAVLSPSRRAAVFEVIANDGSGDLCAVVGLDQATPHAVSLSAAVSARTIAPFSLQQVHGCYGPGSDRIAISSDDQWVAYVAGPSTGVPRVMLARLDGSLAGANLTVTTPARFSTRLQTHECLSFAGASQLIWFSGEGGNTGYDLFAYDLIASTVTNLTRTGGTTLPFSGGGALLPDGWIPSTNSRYAYFSCGHLATPSATDLVAVDLLTRLAFNLSGASVTPSSEPSLSAWSFHDQESAVHWRGSERRELLFRARSANHGEQVYLLDTKSGGPLRRLTLQPPQTTLKELWSDVRGEHIATWRAISNQGPELLWIQHIDSARRGIFTAPGSTAFGVRGGTEFTPGSPVAGVIFALSPTDPWAPADARLYFRGTWNAISPGPLETITTQAGAWSVLSAQVMR